MTINDSRINDSRTNDSRKNDPRRDLCDRLARKLAETLADGSMGPMEAAELLASAGLTHAEAEAATPAPTSVDGPPPISIWRPEMRDGALVFRRPVPLPLGDHYATRREIPADKPADVLRVAFLGESAATGYLYAPRLTCAGVLASHLQHLDVAAETRCDVVDLARTNERLSTLIETAEASLQLDPDVLVVFVGNNWNLLETPEVSAYARRTEDRVAFGRVLHQGGLEGGLDGGLEAVEELARERLRLRAEEALDRLAALAIPTVLVVPEVDVTHWQSRQPVPWLPGDATPRWHEFFRQAVHALDEERFEEAAALAGRMARLAAGRGRTGGTASLILGLALRGQARPAELAFRDSVDEDRYATAALLGAPRANTDVRELLRSGALRHGFRLVDLPEVFAATQRPVDRLFLDYCHLSAEGMSVAMAEVGSAITDVLGLTPARPFDLHQPCDAETEATARIGAAIHAAHRMTPVDDRGRHVERLLRSALDAAPHARPGVAEALRRLLASRGGPAAGLPNRVEAENLASPLRLLVQHGWRWDHLDPDLLLAICRVLDEDPTVHIQAVAVDTRTRRRNLVEPPYLWDPVERFFPEAMDDADSRRAVLRCPWPTTDLCLPTTGASVRLELELVARLPTLAAPGHARRGDLELCLDGAVFASVPLDESWRRHRVMIDAPAAGLHRLRLRWPDLPVALDEVDVGDAALAGLFRLLEKGHEATLHPVFGELAGLWVGPT